MKVGMTILMTHIGGKRETLIGARMESITAITDMKAEALLFSNQYNSVEK